MPAIPLVDSHVHFWDPSGLPRPWLSGAATLNRPFLPADHRTATAGLGVDTIVFVETDVSPASRLAEAQWVASLAAGDPRIQGIVAAAGLEDGDAVRPHLQALTQVPGVKGVRRLLQGESDAAYCLRPGFVRGVQLLAGFGFSFDICIRHHQLGPVTELVRRCPGVLFMLDHVAKPAIKDRVLDPWKPQIRELARLPNVCCKVSGMITEADHRAWMAADLRPYIEHVIDCFGFDRVAFGSDWPVCTLAGTYRQWFEALSGVVAGCSVDEQRNLFRQTAIRFYRLAGS